jgi:hypothetical protein
LIFDKLNPKEATILLEKITVFEKVVTPLNVALLQKVAIPLKEVLHREVDPIIETLLVNVATEATRFETVVNPVIETLHNKLFSETIKLDMEAFVKMLGPLTVKPPFTVKLLLV